MSGAAGGGQKKKGGKGVKTTNTPNTTNKTKVVAKPPIKEVTIKVTAKGGGKTVEAKSGETKELAVDCGKTLESITGEATIVYQDGSTEPATEKISWMWVSKERGKGASPAGDEVKKVNGYFDRSVRPVLIVAKVELSNVHKATAKVQFTIGCKLDQKKSDDVMLLARLTYAEAGGQSDDERAAIAWSVVNRKNRVATGNAEAERAFGDKPTLQSVIEHKADGKIQYEAYWKQDAQWKAIDNPETLACEGCARLKRCIEIADEVLSGKRADPYAKEGGAYYFHLGHDGVISGDRKFAIRRLTKRADFTHHFWTYDP